MTLFLEEHDTIEEPALPEPVKVPFHVENIDLKTFESGAWSEDFCQKMNIHLRPYEYQRELVQSAIEARNTIICLPTGAGKTLVVGKCSLHFTTMFIDSIHHSSAVEILSDEEDLVERWRRAEEILIVRLCTTSSDFQTATRQISSSGKSPDRRLRRNERRDTVHPPSRGDHLYTTEVPQVNLSSPSSLILCVSFA